MSRIEGIENAGVLDAVAHDAKRGELILAMYELRPWTGGEAQLFQLQEKLNAYASYILDGEMTGDYPDLKVKKVRIQLRTPNEPPDAVMELVRRVREQLELQDIAFEVILMSQAEPEPEPAADSEPTAKD